MIRNEVFDKGVDNGVIDPTGTIIRTKGSGGNIAQMWVRDTKGNTVILDNNGKVVSESGATKSANVPAIKRTDPALEAVQKAVMAKDAIDDTAKAQAQNHGESISYMAQMNHYLSKIVDHTGEFKDKELAVNIEQQNSVESKEQDDKATNKTVVLNTATSLFSGATGRGADAKPRNAANSSAQRIAKGN
jgi:hypothetical protein